MGANSIEKHTYENSFYLINNGEKALNNNWIIYFNQSHAAIASHDSTLVIEQISGSYYKLYPSKYYKPIEAGDTLKFTFRCRGAIIKTSQCPEGAYIIMKNSQGKESSPVAVEIFGLPFTHANQWSRLDTDELPYPYGEIIYTENNQFNLKDLQPTDIFPSIKSVRNNAGTFIFTRDVEINLLSPDFQTEYDFLKTKLVERYNCVSVKNAATKITIEATKSTPTERTDAYTIHFNKNHVAIKTSSPSGAFYAVQTLLNILGTNTLPFTMSAMQIDDYADFKYRGFMLDVARNFTKKENIFKLIDILSLYKLNALHLHLSDDEGWRIQIPGLEELTDIGSKRGHTTDERNNLYPAYGGGWNAFDTNSPANGYYSTQDFIDILQYAKYHHIKVIPEIDLPGHARAAIKAMEARYFKHIETNPQKAKEYLLSDLEDKSVYKSAQSYTDNTVCVALPSTYSFVEKVVTELKNMYNKAGLELDVFHIGGDEVPQGAWTGSEVCKDLMKKHNIKKTRELKDYFVTKTLAITRDKGIQMAGWQELALLPDKTVNPLYKNAGLLTYCWSTSPDRKNDKIPYRLANADYPVILCNVTNFYFDQAYNKHHDEPGAYWAGFINEINSFDFLPYNIYKSVRTDQNGKPRNIEKDIETKEKLNDSAKRKIIGIEGHLWSETIRNYGMAEYFIFPKIFGLVERAWNASPTWEHETGNNKYDEELTLYKSKIIFRELNRLQTLNVNFRLSQPGIKIVDNLLYLNTIYPEGEIRYTTDGSEPNASSVLWEKPVECNTKRVKAKVFFLGKESVSSHIFE